MNDLTTTDRSSISLPRATDRERDLEAIERQVGALMMTFRDRAGDEDARAIGRAYRMALSDLPTPVVLEAIDRFARGQIARNHAFAPSAAEIHAEADRLFADKQRLERAWEAAKERPLRLAPPQEATLGNDGLLRWDDVPAGTRIIGAFETKWTGARKMELSRAEREKAARSTHLPPEQET